MRGRQQRRWRDTPDRGICTATLCSAILLVLNKRTCTPALLHRHRHTPVLLFTSSCDQTDVHLLISSLLLLCFMACVRGRHTGNILLTDVLSDKYEQNTHTHTHSVWAVTWAYGMLCGWHLHSKINILHSSFYSRRRLISYCRFVKQEACAHNEPSRPSCHVTVEHQTHRLDRSKVVWWSMTQFTVIALIFIFVVVKKKKKKGLKYQKESWKTDKNLFITPNKESFLCFLCGNKSTLQWATLIVSDPMARINVSYVSAKAHKSKLSMSLLQLCLGWIFCFSFVTTLSSHTYNLLTVGLGTNPLICFLTPPSSLQPPGVKVS